ncbi:MAG: hypothetical protein ACXVA9_09205, partial [Bdellovibrionales bacterium]
RIQSLLNRSIFTPAEKGRASGVASAVIGWADRNVASEDFATCSKIFDLLRKEGAKPETWLFNECAATLQSGNSSPSELEAEIQRLIPQDLLTIADFKTTLLAHKNLPFYLYSGAKDPYVPADDYEEELGEVRGLVHYTHFLGTGHDGFYDETQVWDNLLAN